MAQRDSDFASSLRAHRAKADLSQAQLAELVGVDVASIQNWENGDYMPSLRKALNLADALGISLDQLTGRA